MDIFDEELLNFWQILNQQDVKYIMVGGVATNLHGYQRSTEDIDVWLEDTLENRKRFRRAFNEYSGQDYYMLEQVQIVTGWVNLHLNNGYRLDLLVSMKGLDEYTFDECRELASIADIGSVMVPFLQINQLIANKKAVNRPKDQLDIIYLEKILKLREEKP